VTKLAGTVLAKSRQIDRTVDDYLTGVKTRTRQQQMARIQELLLLNQQVTVKLEQAHLTAKARRDVCRRFIRDNTCAALGIRTDQ
jgi:ethanolamine utilization microcompartment shell protein EutS